MSADEKRGCFTGFALYGFFNAMWRNDVRAVVIVFGLWLIGYIVTGGLRLPSPLDDKGRS